MLSPSPVQSGAGSRAQPADTPERIRIETARDAIERVITTDLAEKPADASIVPGLRFGRLASPMPPAAHLFEPSLCIGARGTKRVVTGPVTGELLDAVARLAGLLEHPKEIPVMHGLILKARYKIRTAASSLRSR